MIFPIPEHKVWIVLSLSYVCILQHTENIWNSKGASHWLNSLDTPVTNKDTVTLFSVRKKAKTRSILVVWLIMYRRESQQRPPFQTHIHTSLSVPSSSPTTLLSKRQWKFYLLWERGRQGQILLWIDTAFFFIFIV